VGRAADDRLPTTEREFARTWRPSCQRLNALPVSLPWPKPGKHQASRLLRHADTEPEFEEFTWMRRWPRRAVSVRDALISMHIRYR
jgi:hypothetical protein